MKKFALILLAVMVLGGCQQSDLALKEKCQKYIAIAQNRVKNSTSPHTVNYAGTFFSKNKNSCISIENYLGKSVITGEMEGWNTLQFIK